MTAYHLEKDEGCQEGLKKGLEVGKELGFYRGCIDVWNFTIQINLTCFSWRVQKSIKQMDEMVKKYPMWEEPTAQYLFLRLFEGQVQAICAVLKVKLEYNGYPEASNAKDIEF